MKKKIILSFPFLLLFCILLTTKSKAQSSSGNGIENSILWKVSGKELKENSYLFGTIHAVPKDSFNVHDSIKKYFNLSKALILEANIDVPLKEQIEMAKNMLLPQGKTVKDYMDSAVYNGFYSYLKDSLHVSESKIERYCLFKPFLLSSFVLIEVIGKPKAFDSELKSMAKKKKEVFYLETVAEQMSFIDSIPIEEQVPQKEEDYRIDKKYFELLGYYQKQDLHALDSLFKNESDFAQFESVLLSQRNKKWIPMIEKIIYNQSTFVAVGCAHLMGEEGLVSLMRKQGYVLEPVYFKNK